MNKNVLIIFILILVLASALRFYKLHYGIAGSYVADTQTVSEAMDIGNSLAKSDFSVFARPVKYPFVLSYLILFLHGIYFIGGRIFGIFHSTSDFLKFISLNQGVSFLIARLISIFSGIAIIILSFFISKKLAERLRLTKPQVAAVISSFFVGFSLLLFQFSRLERPHIVEGFFVLFSYFFYLKFIERPTFQNGILTGVGIGLAAGTLQSGVLTGVFLLLPFIQYIFRKRKEYKNIIGGFLSAVVLFALSYPFLFLSFKKAIGLSGDRLDITFSGDEHVMSAFGGHGFYGTVKNLIFYEPALSTLFLLGFLIVIFRHKFKEFLNADGWGFLSFICAFLAIFGLYNMALPRYIVPLVAIMAVWSGPLLLFSLDQLGKRSLKLIVMTAVCILGAFSLVQVFRVAYLLRFPDTRELATDWIKRNTNGSDIILEEQNIIALIPTRAGILENQRLGGNSERRKDQLLLSLSEKEYPSDARSILRGWELKIQNFEQFILKNKIRYIVLSGEDGFNDFNNQLSIFAQNNLKLKTSFSPFIDGGSSPSLFPADSPDPIRELWGIKQMGPEVRIYSTK